jgi:hypothetical protein
MALRWVILASPWVIEVRRQATAIDAASFLEVLVARMRFSLKALQVASREFHASFRGNLSGSQAAPVGVAARYPSSTAPIPKPLCS